MSTTPTTNMTAAEAVDFLNVWGEAELRKVTDMSGPTNQTPPAASTHIRDDTECCLVPVPLVKPADIPRIGVAGSGYAERDTMNDTPTTPTTERAFRAGYEQAKRDAIDRCHIEKDGRTVADNAIDRCIRAIEPLDVRHALARLS